jgi:fatty-acyl-CoA synthase
MSDDSQLSIVRGATEPALFEHTIGEALQRAIAKWPKQEALVSVHQGGRWTYEELGWRVDQFAAGLLAIGLKPGDRVGIWAPNCAEWTLVQFATARVGLILVNINPAYRLTEVEHALKKVGVKALVCAEKFKTSEYVAMISELAPEIPKCMPGDLRSARLPDLRTVIQIGGKPGPGWFAFEGIPSLGTGKLAKQVAEIHESIDRNDAINIQFTSGTTGLP